MTTVDAKGVHAPVKMVFSVVRRKEVKTVVDLVKRFNPNAFCRIEEVASTEKGVFAPGAAWQDVAFLRILRPFRKGK